MHEETQQERLHLDTDDQIAAFFRELTEPGSNTRAAAAGDLMCSRGCVYFQISCTGDMVGDGSDQSFKKKKSCRSAAPEERPHMMPALLE